MATESSTITPARSTFDTDVEARRDDQDADYSGWYCVRTAPFPCPAPGCPVVVEFLTAAHLIVVWPSSDDRMLLSFANDAQQLGREPRVAEYEPDFGFCIPYDVWVSIGRPVHGMSDRPADRPFREL